MLRSVQGIVSRVDRGPRSELESDFRRGVLGAGTAQCYSMYEALFVGSALWIALGGWFSFLSHGNKRCTGMLPIHTIIDCQEAAQLATGPCERYRRPS